MKENISVLTQYFLRRATEENILKKDEVREDGRRAERVY